MAKAGSRQIANQDEKEIGKHDILIPNGLEREKKLINARAMQDQNSIA